MLQFTEVSARKLLLASPCSAQILVLLAVTGTPIPYESLRTYFKSDPASSWGAYVAGCLLVLAHEKGARYSDGISILVASDVPEG